MQHGPHIQGCPEGEKKRFVTPTETQDKNHRNSIEQWLAVGGWRLAVGGWRLAVGSSWLVAVGGGRLVVLGGCP